MNLVEFTEIRELLDQLNVVAGELTPNEREMYAHLAEKYVTPTQGAFDDKTCLEVMLRNIDIRQNMGLKPADATKVVELPRK